MLFKSFLLAFLASLLLGCTADSEATADVVPDVVIEAWQVPARSLTVREDWTGYSEDTVVLLMETAGDVADRCHHRKGVLILTLSPHVSRQSPTPYHLLCVVPGW